MAIESRNPATGELLEHFSETSPAALDRLLDAAEATFADWRRRPFADRADRLRAAARILRAGAADHARIMGLEMGKPLVQGEAEVAKCATGCDWYAEHGERLLAEQPRDTDARRSAVRFEPLGPVLAIMPWNFPFWQVFRFAAPALMAGNTAVLKHASNVPRCALAIEAVLREAGFPEGAFGTALLGAHAVPGLIADRRIRAVTLTGSDRAGSQVGEHAGRALKKSVLELGGSDPFVVFDDADLTRTVRAAADARLVNAGQSCIAAKRFIVLEAVADRFLDGFVAEMAARRVGDPLDRTTEVGPLARADLRDALHRQVEASIARGARCLLGGRVPEGPGAFYPPTVLDDVAPGMPAFDEETFGPVGAVIHARDERHAIALANQSMFGLGASLWTEDRARAERLVPEVEAGCVFVNALVRSDPRLPFGGVKTLGLRPRAGGVRYPRVHQREDGLGRVTARPPRGSRHAVVRFDRGDSARPRSVLYVPIWTGSSRTPPSCARGATSSSACSPSSRPRRSSGSSCRARRPVVVSGFLAGQGYLSLDKVIVAASVGGILGDSVSYELGRHFGRRLVERFGRGPRVARALARTEHLFARHGGVAVFLGRFVGVLRAFAPFVAGISRMPYRRFLVYNVAGGVLWAASFALLGDLAGASWQRVERWTGLAGLVLAVVIGVVLVFLYRREVSEEPAA